MTRILHLLAAIGLLACLAGASPAQEPIRMARTPDISPDGKLVAFSYLGDIWVVETIGGIARPITVHKAHEISPVFSPDGRNIAFSSNRHGNYNVYVIPVQSGKPRRLTFDSATDMVTGWSPDGKRILFASTRQTAFPGGAELYTVPVEGGQVHRVTVAEGRDGVFSPGGDKIAYVRGPGSWYRKGYRGSSNDDIWVSNADGSNNRQLTNFSGQDTSPMWSPDGQWIYYVTEFHGTPANIVRMPANPASPSPTPAQPKQLTFHKDEGVRKARISANGGWIVYECGPDLWVVSTQDGASPRKLAIEVHTDDKSNTERMETFTSSGADEFAVSPNEEYVILAIHGELFRTRRNGVGKPTRLTTTGANNHGAAWSPDMNKIIFVSDRDGQENLYLLEADDPEHPRLSEANHFKTTKLTNSRDAAGGVTFSPDGKRISFVRLGKLWTMNPDGSDLKAVVNEVQVIDYEWAPDSKWLVYARQDGSFASELYIIPAMGATPENPARNVTRYATYNSGVTWSADGKKLAFLSIRRNSSSPSLFVTSLQKPAAPGTEKPTAPGTPVEFDWEDIHLRVQSIINAPVREAAISPDGSRVAFRAATGGGDDLWVANSNGSQVTRLTNNSMRPQQITWSKVKNPLSGGYLDVIYFHSNNGALHMIRAGGEVKPDNSHVATVPFQVKMTIRSEEEYTEMFDQSWRYLSTYFYDPKFHGADWDAIRSRYRPLVKHVAMKEDLYALLYLMMGELNASHLGVGGLLTQPEEPTADLGLLFDPTYRGKGLKIAEVLKRGPGDQRGLNLKPGEIVISIDGVEINDNVEVSELLNGKVNEMITLQITSNPDADPKDPKARRRIQISGASKDRIHDLMYDRWVENNTKRVAELSKGKLGYIHIKSMDEEGLDLFVRSLYSDNFDKEAIVLDVRYNGGGFTHDQVLNYLGAKEHTWFRQRNGGEGLVLRSTDRKWSKPLVLLINNRSYSDAEIFPHAFRTLGLGKLVGQATGGNVIGRYSMRLIDGSEFLVPRTGVYTIKGVNMDKEGVIPDVPVENHPEQLARGIDAQLDKSVEVLLQDVIEWKKKQQPSVAVKPADEKPMPPVPMPIPVPMTPPGVGPK
jgi:tricorn protease